MEGVDNRLASVQRKSYPCFCRVVEQQFFFYGTQVLQKRVQRGKKAPGFSRGDELPFCTHACSRKTVDETGFLGIGIKINSI